VGRRARPPRARRGGRARRARNVVERAHGAPGPQHPALPCRGRGYSRGHGRENSRGRAAGGYSRGYGRENSGGGGGDGHMGPLGPAADPGALHLRPRSSGRGPPRVPEALARPFLYCLDTSRPSPRTNWTRLVLLPVLSAPALPARARHVFAKRVLLAAIILFKLILGNSLSPLTKAALSRKAAP
jgi:hypothetical protein